MSWAAFVRDHSLDVDADARRFYGTTLDQMWLEEDGPHFWGLTLRLTAYEGVVQARVRELAPPQDQRDRVEVEMTDPAVADLFDRG